jgi:hypothetical protein
LTQYYEESQVIELQEYVWSDIEKIAEDMVEHLHDCDGLRLRDHATRADFRNAVGIIFDLIDREKSRQARESMQPSAPKEATR